MNKQALFSEAHQVARQTVAIIGDYMIAFKLALKAAWTASNTSRTFGLAQQGTAQNGKAYIEMGADDAAVIGDILVCEVEITEGRRKNRRVVGKRVLKFVVTGLGKVFGARVRCYGKMTETGVRF